MIHYLLRKENILAKASTTRTSVLIERVGFFFPSGARHSHIQHARFVGASRNSACPWAIQLVPQVGSWPNNAGFWNAQCINPDSAYYFHLHRLEDFSNPLTLVDSKQAAAMHIGKKVKMYQSGIFMAGKDGDFNLILRSFAPGSSPWWMTKEGTKDEWYGQATHPSFPYYIVPWALSEAKTPAESLSRIFLGGEL